MEPSAPSWETKKLSEMNPAPYNPRKITEEEMVGLENNIKAFGFLQNLLWNVQTGNLVSGHQRMKVLAGEGITEAMTCIIDVDLVTEKKINIAMNNPHITGNFDSTLQDLLLEVRDDDAHLFRDVYLDKLLKEDGSGKPGEDDIPEVPEVAITRPGDLWCLGEHRLKCGSSTEHSDVMHLLGDRHAVCMWTDPPYGVDYVGKTKDAKTIKNDGEDGLAELLKGALTLAFDYVLAPGSAVYVAHPAGRNSVVFYTELDRAGFTMRQGLIWAKNVFALGRSDYHYKHEPIWYGCKPGDERFGRGGSGWHGDNAQDSVFNVDKPTSNKEHPTMKPVALVVAMLINSSRPMDWVYEPFAGSSTTLIACDQIGRRCMAMELDPLYVDVGIIRWQEQTGMQATLESTGKTFNDIRRVHEEKTQTDAPPGVQP